LPPTFVFSRSMSGRTLSESPNAGPVPSFKDLVVHPLARRRGIATALLRRVFWEFRHRGVKHVDLKVQLDNPTGAVRLYKELGMREIALDGS
jgi:ribosomal protein S18 acetylase RimI-like enzyme